MLVLQKTNGVTVIWLIHKHLILNSINSKDNSQGKQCSADENTGVTSSLAVDIAF